MLYFITGNANKFREVQQLLPEVQQLDLDLDEIQSLDPNVVIRHKLAQAAAQHDGSFMVEDTSVLCDGLHGLPGTFIKWFIEAAGLEGIARMAAESGDTSATARTVIGYRDEHGADHFFTGEVQGRIVTPRGERGFGWNPIFVPEGHNQSFAQLSDAARQQLSMRSAAVNQLKRHLATT